MSIKAHPRLLAWFVRFPGVLIDGKRLEGFARPLKRSNATAKESDLDILESPRIYRLKMASIEASMACKNLPLKAGNALCYRSYP